jgi:hypothetical protein
MIATISRIHIRLVFPKRLKQKQIPGSDGNGAEKGNQLERVVS